MSLRIPDPPVLPDAAIQRLLEGNRRFLHHEHDPLPRRFNPDLVNGQRPFATVLGCSDSRVPAELVFDQGLGDLFVIRVAGNIVAPSLIGSAEFAVSRFGTALLVVMGHTNCGAIAAAVHAVEQDDSPSKNLRAITDRIKPHIVDLVREAGSDAHVEGTEARHTLLRKALRANVRNSVAQLQHGSAMLEELVGTGQVRIVGAEYELESGKVELVE